MAPRIRGRSGAKRGMENTNPVRPSQPAMITPRVRNIANTVPGATATKTILGQAKSVGGRALGAAGALYAGYEVGSDLIQSLQRGEGFAAIPGLLGQMAGDNRKSAPRGRSGAKRGLDISQTPEAVEPQFADIRGSASVSPEGVGSVAPATTNIGEAKAMASAESSRAGAGYPTGVEKPADYAAITGTGGGKSGDAPTGYDTGLTYAGFKTDILDNLPRNKEISAFAADSGMSEAESKAILGDGSVETVIDGDKEMKTTINQPEQRGLSNLDAGSRAFLDAKGTSMQALRARDEALGLAYQGQNYYAIDRDAAADSADSLVKLDDIQRRSITNRESTAQDFLASRISGNKSDVSMQSDAYLPPSVTQGVVMAGDKGVTLDSEPVLKAKARQFGNARLRMSGMR